MRPVTPVLIYDDFFNTPDAIRNFALGLDFPDKGEAWPGYRTKALHLNESKFFHYVNERILRLLFSEPDPEFSYYAKTCFQKITGIPPTKGWIHTDKDVLTAIVYLTPNAALNTGTSIYRLKENLIGYDAKNLMPVKERLYSHGDNLEEALLGVEENNSAFEETINISNLYNRLVVFDSSCFHAAQELCSSEEGHERLTLISFFTRVDGDLPYLRMRR
jgi:hypothetical protein